jgi:hypothetical protein
MVDRQDHLGTAAGGFKIGKPVDTLDIGLRVAGGDPVDFLTIESKLFAAAPVMAEA